MIIFEAKYTDYFKTRRRKKNKAGKRMVKEIEWNQPSMFWQDPRTKECEIDVQRLYIYKAS